MITKISTNNSSIQLHQDIKDAIDSCLFKLYPIIKYELEYKCEQAMIKHGITKVIKSTNLKDNSNLSINFDEKTNILEVAYKPLDNSDCWIRQTVTTIPE